MTIFLILASFIVTSQLYAQRAPRIHRVLQSSGPYLVKANKTPTGLSKVEINKGQSFIILKSNGMPNHQVGAFPNSGNPHSIEKQNHEFKISANPKMNNFFTKLEMAYDFGVALNGIPFDPGAAEWYQGKRNSKWQYEALSGAIPLGLDTNHAHVQPTGTYHYHGLPLNLLKLKGLKAGAKSHKIGHAADGFPIHVLYGRNGKVMTSSYQLRKGTRSIGGRYDGTFVADYEFVKGSGDLDECNGMILNREYVYFLTYKFPVIPRCFKGTPDKSFRKGRRGSRQPSQNHLRPRYRRRPPIEAKNACNGKQDGETCSFQGRHGILRGTCFNPPGRTFLVCRP